MGRNELLSGAVHTLTCEGRWLDVYWRWFDDGKHRGLQGLDDNGVGLQGRCCVG